MSTRIVVALLLASVRAGIINPPNPNAAYTATVFSQRFPPQPPARLVQYDDPAQLVLTAVPGMSYTSYGAPLPTKTAKQIDITQNIDDSSVPQYQYAYVVVDPGTGDRKSQTESRQGDAVKGEYSLVQPDGVLRKVAYTADDANGFNAVVNNYEQKVSEKLVAKPANSESSIKNNNDKKTEDKIEPFEQNSNKSLPAAAASKETNSDKKSTENKSPPVGNLYKPKNETKNNATIGMINTALTTLSYDDIVKCAQQWAQKLGWSKAETNIKLSKTPEQLTKDSSDILNKSQPALTYVANPVILCANIPC